MDIAPAHGTAEIGHILWGPRIARTPVATEAFFLLADHMMTTLAYRRWQWRCNAANAPSRRAAGPHPLPRDIIPKRIHIITLCQSFE